MQTRPLSREGTIHELGAADLRAQAGFCEDDTGQVAGSAGV
jgi:hypothetical protein